ncbi:glutamate-gated chloride channel-like isoform X1 [Hydractinia symbiolongicarpus]|uniref:glutamate-gated chloride channel-like isoform X1 n=1 Tax=Hydractinia symbiolongicarpus TaxID=13093 RepID=UPI00254C3CEC|nr:glutamate-gated chloride channel-like isoform X1 [Hydractinia symbiolongicarpus]
MPIAGFLLEKLVTRNYTRRYFNSSHTMNQYSCLEVDFHLSRTFTYYLFNVYAPSILLVAMTYASFFIPPGAIPGRISLIVTNLLSTMLIFQNSTLELNKLDYRTYLDYFFLVDILFILSTMAEYICILFLKEYNMKRSKARKNSFCNASFNNHQSTLQGNTRSTYRRLPLLKFNMADNSGMNSPREKHCCTTNRGESFHHEELLCVLTVDTIARAVFPVLYCGFLGVYAYYISYS